MAFGTKTKPGRDAFDDFLLKTHHASPSDYKRAVAHNLLIDKNVAPARKKSYRSMGAMGRHSKFEDWKERHNSYLEKFVFIPKPTKIPPLIDRNDPTTCPETFKPESALRDFGGAAPELYLIRLESVRQLTNRIRHRFGEKEISRIAKDYLNEPDSPQKKKSLAKILEEWNKWRDLRPLWTGFWEEMHDLFGETSAQDRKDWADELRNRLGLYHLSPQKRSKPKMDVLLFKYPIRLVPRIKDRLDSRGLAIPAVLDNQFSAAFFPAPKGHPHGYSVYLGDRQPYRPYREIVHYYVAFEPDNLFRIGTIKKPMPSDISRIRGQHLEWIRRKTGRADYGNIY